MWLAAHGLRIQQRKPQIAQISQMRKSMQCAQQTYRRTYIYLRNL